jgi:hypothetical protein
LPVGVVEGPLGEVGGALPEPLLLVESVLPPQALSKPSSTVQLNK